ncbi:MAG: alpha/beta hydrolase [Caldisericia bacterium]|nr:alpha/beta hydrolase [Caldisericia bacterium]
MKKFLKILLISILIILIVSYLYSLISIKLSYKDLNSLIYEDSKFIKIDNFNLHYREHGEGDKIILLIHGFAASTYSFKDLFLPLSKYGKVIAIDLPGFGLTERPMKKSLNYNPYSREGQVEVIKKFLDTLKIRKVIILGHSMGGGIATYFTIKYPQYVEKLIIEDGALFDQEMGGVIIKFLRTPIGKFLWPLIVKPLVNQISKLKDIAYYEPNFIKEIDLEEYKKALFVKNWEYGLYEIAISQENLNLKEKLKQIENEVLIIWGEFDKVIPKENGYEISSLIKNSEFKIIKECGHVPHEEKRDEFLNILVNFIEK